MSIARDLEDVRELLAEAQAYLDATDPGLATLEAKEPDATPDIMSTVAGIFRAFPSLKSAAGLLSLGNVQASTHRAEETLDRIRTGRRPFERDLGAALLESRSLLRKFLSALASTGEDTGFEHEKAAVVARFREFCEKKRAIRASLQDANVGATEHVDAMLQCLIGLLDAPSRLSILTDTGALAERWKMNAAALALDINALDEKIASASAA